MRDQPHFDIYDQAANPAELIDQLTATMAPPEEGKPRVVFPSELVLNEEREKRLVNHAMSRYRQMDEELGRSETLSDSSGSGRQWIAQALRAEGDNRFTRRFFPKRMLYQLMMADDFTWRESAFGSDSIYAKSNLSVPIVRRIVRQMTARANSYFFGTEPYFTCFPEGGVSDQELSDTLQKLVQRKLRASCSLASNRKGVRLAFENGEAVIKTTGEERRQFFRKNMEIAVDPHGNPLLAQDGMPITPADLWTVVPGTGAKVLKRDGTPHPGGELTFQMMTTEQENVLYSGPRHTLVYWRDFMAPLTAPSIQEADCVVHIIPMTASALAQTYMTSGPQDLESVRNAVQAIRTALAAGGQDTTAAAMRPETGDPTAPDMQTPTMEMGEFYLRFDADNDGVEEEIMMALDLRTGTPIYYNYLGNVTLNGERPFSVVTPNQVPGRWYGVGAVELFENLQNIIDLLTNRRNYAQSAAGRVTFWEPSATVEGDSDPNLKLNGGKTYRLKPGKTIEEAVKVFYLDDNKHETLTQDIEFFLQLALNESGMQHANDSGMAGMESTKLATGIRNVEKSGQELFGAFLSELEPGIEHALKLFVYQFVESMDETESAMVKEGEIPQELLLAKADVNQLDWNVQVLMTRFREEQILASSQGVLGLIGQFLAYGPNTRMSVLSEFSRQLKALGVQNPQVMLQDVHAAAIADMMAGIPPGAAGGPVQAPPQDSGPTPNL